MTPKLLCSSATLLTSLALLSGASLATAYQVSFSSADPALKCGSSITPTVTFSGLPAGTKSVALIFWDRSASGLQGRWAIRNLPASDTVLQSVSKGTLTVGGGTVSANQVGETGFTAPCAKGRHDLYIDLYALNTAKLEVKSDIALRPLYNTIHKFKIQEAKAHVVLTVK